MASRGLLSRIDAAAGQNPRRGDPVESITEHLRALLNTRQGAAPVAPTFGIPDFNDVVHTLPAAIPRLQLAIRRAIQEFEPRLRDVRVEHAPEGEDPSALTFEITAQLEGGSHERVRFQTRVAAGGHVHVLRR